MRVKPVAHVRDPRYPTADVVMADPRVLVTTKKTWLQRYLPMAAAVGGTAVLTAVSYAMLPPDQRFIPLGGGPSPAPPQVSWGTPGLPCPTPLTESDAMLIVRREFRRVGYNLQPCDRPLHGVSLDGATADHRIGVECVDPDYGAGDAVLDDARRAGKPWITLADEPDTNGQPPRTPDTIVVIFDDLYEGALVYEVQQFIRWLESQQ